MNLKNTLRNALGIRADREILPPGPKPPVGSNIVRERLRLRLKFPISDEDWVWLTEKGWRTIDMRTNRRRYFCVPDKFLLKMLDAEPLAREILHRHLLNTIEAHQTKVRRHRTSSPPMQNSRMGN